MSGKEKLYFLLNRIDDVMTIAPSGQPLKIDPLNDLSDNYTKIELSQLFTKLEKDELVLKVLKASNRTNTALDQFDPYDHADDGCWHIESLPAFDEYFLHIQQEPQYQEFSNRRPVRMPTKSNNTSLMTYEEKLDIIVKAIIEARKATINGQSTKLYINDNNGLNQVGKEEVQDILQKLQVEEKILSLNYIINRLLPMTQQPKNVGFLLLDIHDSFDNWYVNYQIRQKGKIENLSEANFKTISALLEQIKDQFQFSQSDKFIFSFVSSTYDIEGYDGRDIDELTNGYLKALEYLKKIGILKDYLHTEMSLDAEITLNLSTFLETMDKIKKIKQAKEIIKPTKPITSTSIGKTSKAAYDSNKGVLSINDKIVKLNKDSFRAKLVELILKDEKSKKKEWSWDEVIEVIEGTKDKEFTKENKNKFYPACDGLSKHIALKTSINDFLLYTKSTVQLNPKYG